VDTLEFLFRVWGQQADALEKGSAFVFLSLRRGPNEWEDLAYKWACDEIVVPDPQEGDVYFCPNLFMRPRRRKELVLPSCWLYADLDKVKPYKAEHMVLGLCSHGHGHRMNRDLEPSIAWESSPGRYQALWHLDRPLRPLEHSALNRKLSWALGADKGGWDITQVLRVPGTINHKYDEKPEVKLLWA